MRPAALLRERLDARVRPLWLRVARARPVVWLVRALRGFVRDHCMLRASALTYASLLSIVPLLAVVFSLLQAAGFESRLRPFLLDAFPVLTEEAVDQLIGYVGRANAEAVGGVGFAALLLSTWALFGNVEATLNHVYGIGASRGPLRRIGEYVAMLIVGTLIMVLSFALQTVLGSPALFENVLGHLGLDAASFLLQALPWLTVWAGFAFLYGFMPGAPPRGSAIAAGALVGGTLFQVVQLSYIELQFGFARYNAIYGALAQLPILLVWIYASWAVVLFGAEASAAFPASGVRPRGKLAPHGLSPAVLALAALREVVLAFEAGRPTPRVDELAVLLDAPPSALREALEPLLRARLLAEPADGSGLLPATAPSTVPLSRVIDALRE